MDSLTFLDKPGKAKPQPIYVLVGDEPFLKRRVLDALRLLVLGPEGGDFGLSAYPGDRATFAAVFDELQTLPFLSPRRLVLLEDADPFVTRTSGSLTNIVGLPMETVAPLLAAAGIRPPGKQ